jgi:hypothetical protein
VETTIRDKIISAQKENKGIVHIKEKVSVGVRSRGGPKPMSKCCVSLSWMVMQGEHTGVYPSSGKRRPYVQRGGEFCISLHRGACVGVTSL